LHDGSEIRLGNITLRALHTPGHTPEHLSFLVIDGARTSEPAMLLTGDFVFVGDLGRPDLLDEAAGATDTRFVGATQLFESLRDTFLTLPDYVQVWPGHGSGSACGKSLGAVESSTVGYERLFAWWAPYLLEGNEKDFTQELLSGQPDAPAYFGRMKRQNKEGPASVPKGALLRLEPSALSGKLLIDTRSREAYQGGFLPGSINLTSGKTFESWAGWLIDPETEPRPLVLLAADAAEAQALRERLWRVGIDNVVGYITTLGNLPTQAAVPLPPAKFNALDDKFVLDVRTKAEHEAGHIPEATLIPAGKLPRQLSGLPKDQPIVVHCQSGMRSVGAASLLRANGFKNVLELAGGYPNWQRARNADVTEVA
jgi:hydroxyacylglutathione hydrolase